MKEESLSESIPLRGKGNLPEASFKASKTQTWALFLTGITSVHWSSRPSLPECNT